MSTKRITCLLANTTLATRMAKFGEFDLRTGSWQSYCDRLEMYFLVNAVKDDLKLPTLISFMGEAAYELLTNLCSPRKPADMTFTEVVKVMREHVQPNPSILAERYKFRQRRQQAGENISDYVAELKKITRYCEFGTSLDDNLRDQFVCGIMSDLIRQRLFAEGNSKFVNAVSVASALEAAERDAAAVDGRGRCHVSGQAGVGGDTFAAGIEGSSTNTVSRRSSAAFDQAGDVHRMQVGGCAACGDYRHTKMECRFSKYQCSKCKEIGHLRRMCQENGARGNWDHRDYGQLRSRGGGAGMKGRGGGAGGPRTASRGTGKSRPGAGGRPAMHTFETQSDEDAEDFVEDEEPIYQMSLSQYRPVSMNILVNNVLLTMEIDTGSPLSCISSNTYEEYFSDIPLLPCKLSVKFYNGTKVQPRGYLEVTVTYKNQEKILDLYVFKTGSTTLLGRQWLSELNISIPPIKINSASLTEEDLTVEQKNNILCNIYSRYHEVFDGGLGCFTGGRATLHLREGAVPVFCRARPLPYALRARVDAELEAMLRAGIIEPVDTSDWATPLVIVHKPDGALRLCADYKVTVNHMLRVDKYPVPKIDDLFTKLSGSRYFTKLDLSQAYNQILLDESKDITVINTHKGLFRYNRLVYGLASSPGIFQRIMTQMFDKIPNVTIFLDDILITGNTIEVHIDTINKVLKVLQENGLKIKKAKCDFMSKEAKYLGFIITRQGVKVDPEKIKPIIKLSSPTNVSELKSFLGMVNFYGKFIKNLSYYLSPFYELLKKGKHWVWSNTHAQAFNKTKKLLISSEILSHYDESRPVIVTCDASSRGIGAVLAQRATDGHEYPIAYASRTLTSAEYHYSQIHKEALAIVFAVKKFHQYLYGRPFVLKTDHKPLVSIFGSELGIPSMTASRLQRWALILSAYDFKIEYVNTNSNTADSLSRLVEGYKSISETGMDEVPEQTYLHFASDALLLNHDDIRKETKRDPMLTRILSYVRDGWPREVEINELRPYFNRRREIYTELGCLMWGHRLIVPRSCQDRVLMELHDTHMGIIKTKCIARSYVWWPGIDEMLENQCRNCTICAEMAEAPVHHAPQPWNWPSRPWTRLHVDFLGPIHGHKYLIMVDATSKWIEACRVTSTTAKAIIDKIREIWSRFGIPKQLVSDNGPPFSSEEFNSFLKYNGVEHVFSAPYHPASNGLAENAVRQCKRVIKKAIIQNIDVELALQRYLLVYRTTEHSTTKESPSQILQGRTLRTRLDRLKPSREKQVADAQHQQKNAAGGTHRALGAGDEVWCRVYQGLKKWVSGTVIERLGTTDYQIKLLDGTEIHRHIDQLKLKCKANQSQLTDNVKVSTNVAPKSLNRHLGNALVFPTLPVTKIRSEVCSGGGVEGSGCGRDEAQSEPGLITPDPSEGLVDGSSTTGETRLVRNRRPPKRYGQP